MTLGERIQNMRKEMGLSQEELAERIGVSRQSVSKWENDAALPDTDKVLQLSRLFGVSADALLTGSSAAPQAAEENPSDPPAETAAAQESGSAGQKPAKKSAIRMILAAALAVAALGLAIGAALIIKNLPAKEKTPEPPRTYPYVLVHGMGGWGDGSGMNTAAKYWGADTGDLAQYLRNAGYTVYTPGVGPISSAWDRACELYAVLTGARVDYGAAHAAAHNHARYGRNYAAPMVENWDAEHKLNLVGHSFGGETVRLLASLLTYGDAAETANGAKDISPLFTGGKGEWIHSVTALCSPHNGSSLTCVIDSLGGTIGIGSATELVASLCFTAAGIANPLNGVYDFMLDQFGLTEINGGLPEITAALEPILRRGTDHAGYDLSPDGAAALNEKIQLDPYAYYFSYAYRTTEAGSILYNERPRGDTLPVLIPFALAMGSWQGKTPGGITIDSAWLPNDGLVNVISAEYPFGDPHTVLGEDAPEKGVWSVAPLQTGHHGTVIGLGANAEETHAFYINLFQMIDGCE